MADFNNPTLTSLYTDMLAGLKSRDVSALQWLDGSTDTNVPSGAKRWNAQNNYFEKFNGTAWGVLSTKYMIDVDKLDGCTVNDVGTSITDIWTASKTTTALSAKLDSVAYTASDILTKIKTVDGATSGLDADLLDGMHATNSNTVSSVVSRDASGNFSAGTITATLSGNAASATTLTSMTTSVTALNYVDGVTSPIQTQLGGKLSTTGVAADSSKLGGAVGATDATANTIVKRDASGYIYGAAINSTLADTATAATHYYVETGSDGWLRPKTLANVKAELTAGLASTTYVNDTLTGGIYQASITFTGSSTWTCPAGVYSVLYKICAGGSGGPGVNTVYYGSGKSGSYTSYSGLGGHSSSYVVGIATTVPGTVYTITVGAGGAGGGAGANGAAGGSSSAFGIIATGATYICGGSNGVTRGTGTTITSYQPSVGSTQYMLVNAQGIAGAPGPYGGGGATRTTGGTGNAATNIGAGGGGGWSNVATDYGGGAGYRGQVEIYW